MRPDFETLLIHYFPFNWLYFTDCSETWIEFYGLLFQKMWNISKDIASRFRILRWFGWNFPAGMKYQLEIYGEMS